MALRLYLLRHGQAVSDGAGDPRGDHLRRLTVRGEREIARLAACMAARDFAPQVALVSSAERTRRTAELMGVTGLRPLDALYNADPGEILALLRNLPAHCRSALVVAHNPGISWLAASLLRPRDTPGFSPGSLIELTADGVWADLAPGVGRLVRRLDPPEYLQE